MQNDDRKSELGTRAGTGAGLDSLGDRMKSSYESRYRISLPRRTYTIIRVDGKSFHTYTRNLSRPYDLDFMSWMEAAAIALCDELQGAQFAFVQSDEISILLTDFAKPETCAAFDGNLQKLCSISASIATAQLNLEARESDKVGRLALFDSRAFIIPDPTEVENYFIWRQKDAERNSIQMLAQSHASPRQLHGKPIPAQHDIIYAAGDNWNDHPSGFKRGRCILREEYVINPDCLEESAIRSRWVVTDTPIFTQERDFLRSRIPRYS